jgi:hypothetical protein
MDETQDKGRRTQDKKMQNKTNFRKAKMNISSASTKNYKNDSPAHPAKTKPISPASGGQTQPQKHYARTTNYQRFSKNLISRIKTRICRKSKTKIRGISGEIGGFSGKNGGKRGSKKEDSILLPFSFFTFSFFSLFPFYFLLAKLTSQFEPIMSNEPNFSAPAGFASPIMTRTYNEKMPMDTWSKRTQSKPLLVIPYLIRDLCLSSRLCRPQPSRIEHPGSNIEYIFSPK